MQITIGFRTSLSTTNVLIKLVKQLLDCFEEQDLAAVTFCDLSKAFDYLILPCEAMRFC